MTQNPNDTQIGESSDDYSLDRPERNRYFHGKLMTARDMQAEQRYHRGNFRTHARHVSGDGVVCGLDVDVEGDDDGLTVTVEPGYALDSYGRPVVVPNKETKEIGPTEVPDDDRVSIYVDYDECVVESVPIPGSEKSCEEECAYNRVLEVFEIRCEGGDPEEGTVKSVPGVEFPTHEEVEEDADGLTNAELATIAQSFTVDDENDAVACETGNPTVFLGVFDHVGGTTWEWNHEYPRSRVYTNDMLYAATADHTADFENPHQVSLETRSSESIGGEEGGVALHVEDDESPEAYVAVTSDDTVEIEAKGNKELNVTEGQTITDLKTDVDVLEADVSDLETKTDDHIADETNPHESSLGTASASDGAALFVEDDESADANVTVTSSDRTVAISADAGTKEVDLTAGEALVELIEERIAPMAQYVMDKTLKYKLRTFSGVADAFGNDAAGKIAEATRDAILERVYVDREAYLSFIGEVHELERTVAGELEGQATTESLERYGEAVERLAEALAGTDERGVLRVAVAQDEVCEAAEWLEVANDDFRESLRLKRDAFAAVAERFENETAREIATRAEQAIAEGAFSPDAYRSFIETVIGLEGRVASELQETVTQASHERYVSALRELYAAMETGDARDVMTAQNGVSRAATEFVRGEETPDEVLLESLHAKRSAFAGVSERFGSDAAQRVAAMAGSAIEEGVATSEEQYVGFIRTVSQAEQEVAASLQGSATSASLEAYGAALGKLDTGIEEGVSAHDLAAAQNGVSQAAGELQPAGEPPGHNLVSSLEVKRNSFAEVAERFGSDAAQWVASMAGEALNSDSVTTGENYVGFIREVFQAEQDVGTSLEGTVTAASLESYRGAINDLSAALEEDVGPSEVANAQDRVSQAARELQPAEEQPDEVLVSSLKLKHDAFSAVSERFGSDVAQHVVTVTEDALGGEPVTSKQAFRSFIEEVFGPEQELLGELGDGVTQESLDRYETAIGKLGAVLDGETTVYEVASAQNGVSQAAGRLAPRTEDVIDETLLASLKNARTAFAGVAERFGSDVAQNVVEGMEWAINNDVAADGEEYVGHIREVVSAEQDLVAQLEGAATQTSHDRYRLAVSKLTGVLEQGAGPQEVAAYQNGVSQAASQLAVAEETPDETLQAALKSTVSAFSGVVERFDSQTAHQVVTMTKAAIDEGVATSGEQFVEFVTQLAPVERELGGELDGTASATTLEAYGTAVSRLLGLLEQGASPREVAAAQYRVSQAAGGLQPAAEVSSEDVRASLKIKYDAFSGVVERFDSPVAKDVASMAMEALEAGLDTPDEYVSFVRQVVQRERELLEALAGTATQSSLGSYAVAVNDLETAIAEGASAQDLVSAQNGVSRAAGMLEPVGDSLYTGFLGDTIYPDFSNLFDLAVDPTEYTVSGLEEELDSISDPMILEEMLASEMLTENRKTAKNAINARLDELTQ